MWRPFLLVSASVAELAGTALAADLPVAPPPPPPVFTWTGLYVGGYGGGEITHSSYNTVVGPPLAGPSHFTAADAAVVSVAGGQTQNKGGFTAGGQLGYNWQIGMVVLGFETDIGGVTGSTRRFSTGAVFGGVPFGMTQSVANGLFGTVRGRAGLALDRLLIYATGGLAYTSGKYLLDYSDGVSPAFGTASAGNKVGYVVGGGVEYALNNNWSVKGEFLYSQFSRVSATGQIINLAAPAFTNTLATSARVQNYTGRVGLNYRFNWFAPPPVVAKY
jgi:outer membrane immunogenic protein